MATDFRPITMSNASDALFRAWVAAIEASLLASGATKTSDTGQIDTATVSAPATAVAQGYGIYRFDDTLHNSGGKPVYLKIEYGAGAGSTVNPSLYFTVATGTNGAGTLTGTTFLARTTLSASGAQAATNVFTSNSSSRFSLHVAAASAANAMTFSIERTRDINGTLTDEGVLGVSSGQATTVRTYILGLYALGAFTSTTSATHPIAGMAFGQSAAGNDLALSPMQAPVNGKWRYPLALFYNSTPDITVSSTFSTTHLSSTHSYIALGTPGGTVYGNNLMMAMPWE